MQTWKGSVRHRSSSELTARGSTSGTSSSAGASRGSPPRRATRSARWVPVRDSKIATTFDFIRQPFKHHNDVMSTRLIALLRALIVFANVSLCSASPPKGPSPPASTPPSASASPSANTDAIRQEFMAAMQRVRLHQPDLPDSPALEGYAIHDYLVAARLRRDLGLKSDENDATIDAFLHEHAAQPVARGLRREWLASLAQRRRWDWFLPRSADVVDPVLVCDRLQGRLATHETQGLAAAALLRWLVPQKPPAECSEVFSWLRQQGLLTPALAETRARTALAADLPRLAREFAGEVPVNRRAD